MMESTILAQVTGYDVTIMAIRVVIAVIILVAMFGGVGKFRQWLKNRKRGENDDN